MKAFRTIFVFGIYSCMFVQFAVAHGTGVSVEKEQDGYFIDIGYDAETPEALQSIHFDFDTYLQDNPEAETYTDVWVRIAQGRELFFSGDIHNPTFGSTGFSYMFPKEGEYEVTARFQKGGEKLVETSFPITVVAPVASETVPVRLYVFSLIGFLVGVMSMFLFKKSK